MKTFYPIRMDICSDSNYSNILINMYDTSSWNWDSPARLLKNIMYRRWFTVMVF